MAPILQTFTNKFSWNILIPICVTMTLCLTSSFLTSFIFSLAVSSCSLVSRSFSVNTSACCLALKAYPICVCRSKEQGKSEGFESCDRPIVRKRPIWVKIGDVLSHVTWKFDGWPWKTIGHLFFAVSSFVQHFIAISEFKLELQSENAQFGSRSMIFRAVWPCNLTYDLEKQ